MVGMTLKDQAKENERQKRIEEARKRMEERRKRREDRRNILKGKISNHLQLSDIYSMLLLRSKEV